MKRISVKVTPNASKPRIEADLLPNEHGLTHYKIWVNVPPEDGKANKLVIEMLADYFDIAKSKIKIISGLTNRNKVFEIED